MRSSEAMFASDDVEGLGLACAHLSERYYKAALYAFKLDRSVIPYMKSELRKRARYNIRNGEWSKQAAAAMEVMICILLYDVECGGRLTEEYRSDAVPITRDAIRSWRSLKRAPVKDKAEALGVSRATWYRHYAKPYAGLYMDVMGWAMTGRSHVFRMENYEDLDC